MRCPKCGKDVELQKKQVGVDENGKPIFNEYAICKDCKKQWNLDKQREKKAANANASNHTQSKESATSKAKPTTVKNNAAKPTSQAAAKPIDKKAPVKKDVVEDPQVKKAPPKKRPVSSEGNPDAPVKKTAAPGAKIPASEKKPTGTVTKTSPGNETRNTIKKSGAAAAATSSKPAATRKPTAKGTAVPAKKVGPDGKPMPKRKPISAESPSNRAAKPDEEQRYGNIPPEKVRVKRERAVKDNYEDMLATDPNRKPVKKKRPVPVEDSNPKKKSVSSEPAQARKRPAAQPVKNAPQKKEEPKPKFRILRIIFGLISIAAFAFFAYKGFMAGLNNISAGNDATTGTIYIVLALCMLVSGLLLLIMQKKRTVFAFILPLIFYIGGAAFAFLKRGDDKFLLYGSIACAVLAVIFLILTIASRDRYEDDDYEDEYDDEFEEDHDNY